MNTQSREANGDLVEDNRKKMRKKKKEIAYCFMFSRSSSAFF